MEIYTSYYAKVSRLKTDVTVVQISTSRPSWFDKFTVPIPELYPGWDLLNRYRSGQLTDEQYIDEYEAKLTLVDRENVRQKLREIYEQNGKPLVLCCYESPNKLCHRHLVAEWLDMGVTELK